MKKMCAVLLILCFVLSACSCGSRDADMKKERTDPNRITVGFLPIDTRPCCMDVPVEIAGIAGAEIVMPSGGILAEFKETPDLDGVRSWLSEVAGQCDALVISMEQLVYGGLIQEREAGTDTESRDKALALLRSIKEQYPDLPVYVSNVLMRTTISVFKEEDKVWWEKVNEYSKAMYRSEVLKDTGAAEDAARLQEEIPKDILDTFLQAREVNHALNLQCVELVKEGIIDKLQVCQDDCSEDGIQVVEQEEIKAEIQKNGLEEKISMMTGTDEAGAELVMCAVCPEGCDVNVVWLGDNTGFVPKYDDRPFEQNLKAHADSMNIRFSDDSDNVLCILPPIQEQGDYAIQDFSDHQAYSESEMNAVCDQILQYTEEKDRCYILDLDCANGGTVSMLTTLGEKMDISNISGYSGWNSACNSLGTLLAQVLASQSGNTPVNQAYTAERILDEVVYQSSVRPSLYEQCESKGINVFHIEDTNEVETMIGSEFNNRSEMIRKIFGDAVPDYTANLRWPRLFEISVKVNT